MIKPVELKSPKILNSNMTSEEKELIELFITCAIQKRINPAKAKYFDGILSGIAKTLKILGRKDINDLIAIEYPYHDELN